MEKNKKTKKYTVKKSTLTKKEFEDILKHIKLKKTELALEMGLSNQTVKAWYYSDNTMPMYAEKYLKRLLEIQEYKNKFKEIDSIINILN